MKSHEAHVDEGQDPTTDPIARKEIMPIVLSFLGYASSLSTCY